MKVAAGLHLGHPDDVAYARRYRWYRRFPTRIKPPTPVEYPTISLTVWEGGHAILSMLEAERGGEVLAAVDQGKVQIRRRPFRDGGGRSAAPVRAREDATRCDDGRSGLSTKADGCAGGVAEGVAVAGDGCADVRRLRGR